MKRFARSAIGKNSPQQKLTGWLAASGLTRAAFAAKVREALREVDQSGQRGFCVTHLINVLSGVRGVSYPVAKAIAAATGGAVSVEDVLSERRAIVRRRARRET